MCVPSATDSSQPSRYSFDPKACAGIGIGSLFVALGIIALVSSFTSSQHPLHVMTVKAGYPGIYIAATVSCVFGLTPFFLVARQLYKNHQLSKQTIQ